MAFVVHVERCIPAVGEVPETVAVVGPFRDVAEAVEALRAKGWTPMMGGDEPPLEDVWEPVHERSRRAAIFELGELPVAK